VWLLRPSKELVVEVWIAVGVTADGGGVLVCNFYRAVET